MLAGLFAYLDSIKARDPAPRSRWEILLYPGVWALGLHRVDGRHLARNPASGRVMEKLGMQFEGLHRQAIRKWDRFEDVTHHAILVTDLP